jgi:type III restriction enzyme
MVADTKQWEQSAGFALDLHPAVLRWVKNDHLGFLIPYRKQALAARYIPDFIAVLENGLQLIIEIKGQYSDDADIKAKAAERWVSAMNHLGDYGRWAYLVVEDPPALTPMLDQYSSNTKAQPLLTLDTTRSETVR